LSYCVALACALTLPACTGKTNAGGGVGGSSSGQVVSGGANGRGELMRLAKPQITRHYKVFGKSYAIFQSAAGFEQTGVASWYGPGFHGRTTANGEKYDMRRVSAAHKNLPFGTIVRVENLENGRVVNVRVNDRGPFHGARIIDLSRKAADKIGVLGAGTARVRLTIHSEGKPLAGKTPAKQTAAKPPRRDFARDWDTEQAGTTQQPSSQESIPSASTAGSATEGGAGGKAPTLLKRSEALAAFTEEKNGRAWVQIGSYYEQKYVDIIKEELTILGYTDRNDVRVFRHSNEGSGEDGAAVIHRVRLGPLTAQQAEELLNEVRQGGYYDAFVVFE
ncbi:MAG: septal ring lytic transglycosylase RlpA family protein, partial [Proteobacteria bacterium]|nr:septal ring lytic transglycosylase RlpA family protein [Pseudomonadota bacterium]